MQVDRLALTAGQLISLLKEKNRDSVPVFKFADGTYLFADVPIDNGLEFREKDGCILIELKEAPKGIQDFLKFIF